MDVDVLAGLVVDILKANLAPLQAELAAAKTQIATWESRWTDMSILRERVAVVEAMAAQEPPDDLRSRVLALEQVTDVTQLSKDVSTLRERTAILETRAPIPGPAGHNGEHGTHGHDGKDGRDGRDGLGFGELSVLQTDERSFVVRAQSGEHVKDLGLLTFPVQINRGVWIEGTAYEKGDVVTWGGSQWYAKEQTLTKPGEVIGAAYWTLCVKKGRDGRDGRDGKDASLPVVTVGSR